MKESELTTIKIPKADHLNYKIWCVKNRLTVQDGVKELLKLTKN